MKNEYIFDGQFGLERETLRVTGDGELARTPHPFVSDKNLDRDFCENQLELITPVCSDMDALMSSLAALDKKARKTLAQSGEYLWLNSNPPHIQSENDIPVAQFCGANSYKHDYRINLEHRYGKRLMLYSGIHFNFSFSSSLIKSLCPDGDIAGFKNALYFRLLKQTFRYGWLLLLLSAASPVYDLSLDGDGLSGSGFDGYASRRSGKKGYWNQFVPVLDYTDLNTYIQSINGYISKGALFSAGELYLPVRLKPRGSNSPEALLENGVDHIELRMFDLNPLSPLGVFRSDLEFAHYFLIYLLQLPDFEFTPALQETAVKNHQSAALYDLSSMRINGYPARDAALGLLDDMAQYFKDNEFVMKNINTQREKISEDKRYCTAVYKKLTGDFQNEMLRIAKGGMDNV
ncbi:MAG: glutathione synthase [Clostridiales bacterium]|nr:glutathione synthase [Clostridiales bacterium]